MVVPEDDRPDLIALPPAAGPITGSRTLVESPFDDFPRVRPRLDPSSAYNARTMDDPDPKRTPPKPKRGRKRTKRWLLILVLLAVIATLSWIFGKRPGIDFEAARHLADIITIGQGSTPTRAVRPKPAPRPAVRVTESEKSDAAEFRAPTTLTPKTEPDAPRTVFGRVVDRDGRPLADAKVTLECPFLGTPFAEPADAAPETTTDENGEFSIVLHGALEFSLVVAHRSGNAIVESTAPPAWEVRRIDEIRISRPTMLEISIKEFDPPDRDAVVFVAAVPKTVVSPFGPLPLEFLADGSTGAARPKDDVAERAVSRVGEGSIELFELRPGADSLIAWAASKVAAYRPQRIRLLPGQSRYDVALVAGEKRDITIVAPDPIDPTLDDRAYLVTDPPSLGPVAIALPSRGVLATLDILVDAPRALWRDRALPIDLPPTSRDSGDQILLPRRGRLFLPSRSSDSRFLPVDVDDDGRRRFGDFFDRFDRPRRAGPDGIRLTLDPGRWRLSAPDASGETIKDVVIVAGSETTFEGAGDRSSDRSIVRGRVVDRLGNAVMNAAVAVGKDLSAIPPRHLPWITLTDDDGRFEITAAPDGGSTMIIDSPSHAPSRLAVKAAAGQTTDVGTITLSDGAAIVVDVKTPANRPVAGVDVAIVDPLGRVLFSRSDDLGRAHFPSTAPIEHVAAAFAGRFSLPRDSWSWFQRSAAQQSIVAVADGRAALVVEEPMRQTLEISVDGIDADTSVRLEIVENERDSRTRVATLFGFDVSRTGTAELSGVFPGSYLAIANVGVETRVVPFEVDRSRPERLTLAFDFHREK